MTTTRTPLAGRTDLREIIAYDTDRSAVTLDLSHNTNLWGAPPSALAAVRGAEGALLAEYPGLESAASRAALAAYARVPVERIITGCGSDDLIEATFLGLAEPGDLLAYPEPTFSMVPVFARMTGLRAVAVPLARDHDIDPDALLATGARIIYLATPNNPTGIEAARDRVERVLRDAPGIVLIDEAYAEFARETWIERAATDDRLIVLRTMSKAWGMAGLRFGYGAAAPALVRELEKARGPYRVNALAERAVTAALTHDVAWMREAARAAIESRDRLTTALRGLGLEPLSSATNFVYAPVAGARAIVSRLEAEHGVRIRAHPATRAIEEGIRMGVAPWPRMERLLDALAAVLGASARASGGERA